MVWSFSPSSSSSSLYILLLIRSPGPSPVLQDYTFIRWDIYTIRDFMENFAKSRKTDPLVPETWYNLLHSDLIHIKVCFIWSLFIFSFSFIFIFILFYFVINNFQLIEMASDSAEVPWICERSATSLLGCPVWYWCFCSVYVDRREGRGEEGTGEHTGRRGGERREIPIDYY